MKNSLPLMILAGLLMALPVSAEDYLADAHKELGDCKTCHQKPGKVVDDNLSHINGTCKDCHGGLDELGEVTAEVRGNPHDSHFPGDTACTACHAGHEPSVVYCDACHSFDYDLKFRGKWQRVEPTIAELAKDKADREKALSGKPAATTDVVVIGSGGAGFAATISAHDNGAKVILVEKEPVIGGNAKLAAGGFNAAETKPQAKAGIEDKVEIMIDDTMKGGKNMNNPDLVKILAENSSGSIDWAMGLGADLWDVGRMGGASVNRSHRPTGGAGVGAHLIHVLWENAVKRNVDIRLNTRAVELIEDDNGAIKGVLVKGQYSGYYWIESKAIILASGGFGRNNDRVASYQPSLKGFKATNHPGATGDGLDVAAAAGAELIDLKEIQAHPTLSPAGGVMITEAVRGNGALVINRAGKRFVNEITTRDKESAAILKQEGKSAFLVFDDGVRKSLSKIENYIHLGVAFEADTPQELGKKAGIDGEELAKTIARYNEMQKAGKDEDFGRPDLPRPISEGKLYAIEVLPAVHHTMGGVKINTKTEVVDTQGKVIPGLFAAGEVTGGIHGGNRLGGNAVSDFITFGRLSGESAASYVK